MRQKRWLGVLGLGLAVMLAVPLVVTEQIGQASTEAVLADACENQQDITSLRLVVSATQYEGEQSTVARTELLTDGTQRRHIITTTDRGDREEQIITEDARYFRIGETEIWEKVARTPRDVSPPSDDDEHEHFCGYPALKDITLLGRETLDGRQVLRISARTDMKQKAAILWPPELADSVQPQQFAAGEESFEFWIDEELRLPLQIKIAASFPQLKSQPSYGFEATLRYSNFNKPVKIEPPDPDNVVDKTPPRQRPQP